MAGGYPGYHFRMPDDTVKRDKEQLEHLGEEIDEARKHLKEWTGESDRHFIDEGTEDRGEPVDDTIVPPG
jgi:hypothetical protein